MTPTDLAVLVVLILAVGTIAGGAALIYVPAGFITWGALTLAALYVIVRGLDD